MKHYKTGDTIAIQKKPKKAVSCQVLSSGVAKTKKGTTISFNGDEVIWVLGLNRKWPTFVMKAFRGKIM
jgi:ASC-1-like (ASCH) protein